MQEPAEIRQEAAAAIPMQFWIVELYALEGATPYRVYEQYWNAVTRGDAALAESLIAALGVDAPVAASPQAAHQTPAELLLEQDGFELCLLYKGSQWKPAGRDVLRLVLSGAGVDVSKLGSACGRCRGACRPGLIAAFSAATASSSARRAAPALLPAPA